VGVGVMEEWEIKKLKDLLEKCRNVFWYSGEQYFKVLSISSLFEEDNQPCAILRGGTHCLLENSEPSDFFIMDSVF